MLQQINEAASHYGSYNEDYKLEEPSIRTAIKENQAIKNQIKFRKISPTAYNSKDDRIHYLKKCDSFLKKQPSVPRGGGIKKSQIEKLNLNFLNNNLQKQGDKIEKGSQEIITIGEST